MDGQTRIVSCSLLVACEAGHYLLSGEEKSTYSASKQALHARLDPGSKVLAAQDFRHAIQKDDESIADFIRRMERCFQVAYGRDNLSR